MALTSTVPRRRSLRGSSGGWGDEAPRSFQDATGWIAQQKRLIETAQWGDDPASIDQQLISHQKFHTTIQRSPEVERAKDDLMRRGDKARSHALEQDWESLKKMSVSRMEQLRDLQKILQEISLEIMWVNEREEEELMFDWGDKNIEQYIPKKQEAYSKLMSALEEKEKDLYKAKTKADVLLKNNHPASDKIEAYMDTLQTQWSWLLQITKCIDVHLKENGAYWLFFKEANDTNSALQKEHESIRKKFSCDKDTSLEDLMELLKGLEKEKEQIMEHRRQVQHLVSKSKSIVRLRPRNPEVKSNGTVVKALCDFKQDQKVILTGNEAILKDNSQRSKWLVTGPGGLDMLVPSVCLIIPPPNPLSISIASKNEQYFESILSIWNQLYINVKSLIAWQYCVLDIKYINSLTITMLSKMRPDEYKQIIKNMEAHFEEFKITSRDSQMFADEDKRSIENQVNGAQAHYEKLVVVSKDSGTKKEGNRWAKVTRRVLLSSSSSTSSASLSSQFLTELHALRLRLETAEAALSQHIHICVGDDGVQDCSYRITELKMVQSDVDLMRDEYIRLRERIVKDLEDMNDSDKAQFLRSELGGINQRLALLKSGSFATFVSLRLRALRDMLESVARAEDLVKVHEARLTEKETTSLTPSEVEEYISILKHIKAELDQKRDILTSMEAELTKATHWNSQVGSSSHKCDMMLMKYTEHAGVLSDRWRRIEAQISTRLQDLQLYLPQLHHYKQTSASLIEWIDVTRKKQDAMQATKIDNVQALKEHISNQKALNTEIKAKKETVESVLKDNETCVHAIKDYEGDLASYASGLETLLKIPFKRTMLKSPSTDLNQEFSHIQTRYMELLALSGNYHKFLGELLKSMEELKIRNTRIDMLEEELRQLREGINDSNSKNKSLEEAIGQYELKLSQSQSKLLSLEEVERTTALKCSSTKDSLDSTQSQLADLKDEIERLKYLLGEEKRKSKLAEERYHQQKEEYDSVLKKRQNELETVSWSKMEVEKSVTNKEHEIEQLRRQLAENEAMVKELQKEMSKVRSKFITEISSLKVSYESQIQISRTDIQRLAAQRDEDTAELQLQCDRTEADRRSLEKEIMRLRVTIGQVEEQRKTAEEEARSRQAMFIEEGCRRREMESQVELLMRQRDEESSQYREELAELMRNLQEKSDQLAYVTHSLEEEARRRKITEEGQAVLEQSLAQLQTKLTTSSTATTQLTECKEELQHIRLEFERESEERCRVVQNMNRLQGRIKDLQVVRDELEVQVESLRTAHQEEVNRRKQVEADLEKMTVAMTECTNTTTALRQNQEQASTSQSRSQQECHRLQEELDISMRLKQTTASQINQLNNELKALKQQLLQEEVRVKEANLRNEDLCKSIEEKSEALVENSSELQRLKDLIETQTKERLVLEEELRETQFEKEELMKSKRGREDDLSTQIAALELRLQATERSNLDSCDLVSGLSLERDKFKLEAEKLQKQVTEMQSLQSEYDAIVKDRDALLLKLQRAEKDKEHIQRIEEDLSRMKLSLDSEHHSRQRLQGENERIKMDLSYWKDQCDGKQGLIRQLDSDKEILEREKKSMKSELELLRREIRELEDNYKRGILDPNLSVFLPKDAAMKRNLLDEDLCRALNQNPECYVDPETETDPSKLIFDGVRKPVSAQQLLDCGVLDKPTFKQLLKGEKTVPEVSEDKKVFLKGTGSIAGVTVGPSGKMSFNEAKKQKLVDPDKADLLLEAQAATGHIIDPVNNRKLTVDEACAKGVVDRSDRDKLLEAEASAVTGYKDPLTGKLLSVGQASRLGLIEMDTGLRILQAQESVGGILDPTLSVFLPKDIALKRGLIDEDLYRVLNQSPDCYLDPDTQRPTTYVSIKKKCKSDPSTGLLLLPEPKKPLTTPGFRNDVSLIDLVDANLLEQSDVDKINEGKMTIQEIEERLHPYLRGSTCIAGVYDEARDKVLSIYEAMKNGLLRSGTSLELLEAQAASGFMIDPVFNLYLTVDEAYKRRLVGPEFKDKLLSAEKAVTGYKLPGTDKIISLFQAIEKGVVEKGHGIRLLEAQIASGGLIDPEHSHRINVNVAYKRGYFDEEMNKILTDESDDTKGFFDPNTEENLTYLELKRRCIVDKNTGLILLPIVDKKKKESTTTNTRRRRRVIIVDPETNKEMTVLEAFNKGYIDHETFIELSNQECEWEEITITDLNGSKRFVITERTSGRTYDITEMLEKKVIDESVVNQYHSRAITLTQFADIITEKAKHQSLPSSPASHITVVERSSNVQQSSDSLKRISSVSITLSTPLETDRYLEPVGAIFDTDTVEKISIMEALNRGLVDSITAQKLLEAQACTGGIVDPTNGKRFSIQEACRMGMIDSMMELRLKPAQKAFFGFEDVKTKRRMSIAEAVKERWLPYESGQRFLEFQVVTGGLYDPEMGCRRSIEDALKMGWLDERAAQKLHDIKNLPKCLTCPKSKLKISYKDALDNCLVEDGTGVQMLPASSMSSKGISSPYNAASAPGSTTGSRSCSQRSSRRGSLDYGSLGGRQHCFFSSK
uniref:Desmoplakin b n=1 Tax=Oryzias melastigma TaxID=30732 RepID=A0A3B3DJA9_ORYME